MDYTMNGRVVKPTGNRDPSMAPHGCYRCSGQDRWVTIAIASDQEWRAFCEALGKPEWTGDERFDTVSGRLANQDELDGLIEQWTSQRDSYEVMHLLQRAGVAAAPVGTAADLNSDPHLKERGFFREVTHREAGTHLYPGMCFRLSRSPTEIRLPPNCLGEHNQYVYGEILGMSAPEIRRLEGEQLIGNTYL